MVVEYNDEYCKIILRKDINTEPYEVIDIVDLLEAWKFYKANKAKLQTKEQTNEQSDL